MTVIVDLDRVSVHLDGQLILDHISFQLHAGKITTLIGPNGAGKSTLSRVVLGLQPISSGSLVRNPNLRIGYVPQRLTIDKTLPLTVERFLQLTRNQCRSLDSVLARVGATELRQQSLSSLSGGELQRVLLARALLADPELLVLDEPMQGVDISGQLELYALIAELAPELNCAVLLISHDLHLVLASTDEVICLNRHICCHGAPDSVTRHPEFARLFGALMQSRLAPYYHHHHCNGDHQHLGVK